MLIDVHVHTFPDDLATRALQKLVDKANGKIATVGDGTVGGLLRQMRTAAIDYAVVCPIATRPAQFDGILAEANAIRSGERGAEAAAHLIPFASVHPADEEKFAHLQQVAENGICGIKLHPYYQPCVVDSPEMLEYFRCCRDLNLVVQCHCGFDIGFPFDAVCNPARIGRVLRNVPGLRLIAAHLGGWRQWDEALIHLLGQDVFLDTSILAINAKEEDPQRILREHPADRLLFATDWPWLSFSDGIDFVCAGVRDSAQRQLVLGGNAARLLGVRQAAPW
ncbi:MAG TPA: amidohydrolase family protein [Kiritimatiellia bacterium]|nr:amidohydrolase family protein [Kiritimatiellia bacterium]HRU70024.1 amidohydrolase family protein [Kiritimatiellia bacterium]